LSLIELKQEDGKNLKEFLSNVENGTYQDISLLNIGTNDDFSDDKNQIIELVCDELNTRFVKTEKEPVIHSATEVLDFSNWPVSVEPEELATFGNKSLNILIDHFHVNLERSGMDNDHVQEEWTDFKTYIKRHGATCSFEKLFLLPELRDRFQNLLLLFEILLSFPLSSAACERGFSAMKRIKSDWRSSLGPDMLRMQCISVLKAQLF